MFSLILVLVLGAVTYVVAASVPSSRNTVMPWVLLGGYALRILISLGVRNVGFFAHGVGGDSQLYEDYAKLIVRIWERTSVHYVGADELPMLGATTLPSNIFALIYYVGGSFAGIGCVAVIAVAVALLFLNIHSLAIENGANPRDATTLSVLLYFSPVVLFYTSDTFKDGLVASLTFGALASAVRLSRKFSIVHATIGLLSLWALWHVRFYLVFVTVLPLIVGFVGLSSSSFSRQLLVALGLLVVVLGIAASTDILQHATEQATQTFEQGTARNALQANAGGGSGVEFDDGGQAFGALGPKLAYTLLSPFPWAGGSLGFQIGKVDAFIWYYLLYRTYRSIRAAEGAQRTFILMLATFLIPCTVMYATSVSNVGLIVRQRMIIVLTTSVIAMLASARRPAEAPEPEAASGAA